MFLHISSQSLLLLLFSIFIGGAEADDGEPDKMVIAFQRIGRFKRWIINGIKGFFIGIKI